MPPSRRTSKEIFEATGDLPELLVVRSTARTKTISAQPQEDGSVRLLVPASLSRAQILEYAQQLVPKVEAKRSWRQAQKNQTATDEYLFQQAQQLVQRYLPELAEDAELWEDLSIRWVTNQGKRWGSCTPSQASIRISHLLKGAPEYVLGFVLHHELCHLLEHTHNSSFKALENRYKDKELAEAFLAGLIFGQK